MKKSGTTTAAARAGIPSEVAERLKALERENRELRQTNEILRKASAYFAEAELDIQAMIAFTDNHRAAYDLQGFADRLVEVAVSQKSSISR